MTSTTAPTKPSQVILFSIGRTACHLLERMLSKQPNTDYLFHPMLLARLPAQFNMLKEDSVAAGLYPELRSDYVSKVEDGVSNWQRQLQEARNTNKTLFVHEHPIFCLDAQLQLKYVTEQFGKIISPPSKAGNPTLLPDNLILSPGTTIIMTFRHPAWVVPAAYDALKTREMSGNRSNYLVPTNYKWQTQLYNFLVANGITPILVEAEDYMSSPDFVRHVASQAGLDPESCVFEWNAMSAEEQDKQHPMFIKLQQTLISSTGLVAGKVKKAPVLEDEEMKWREMAGEEDAKLIKEMVEWAMEDYEYLRERKLRMP